MNKLNIPVFKYLAQDMCGDIFAYTEEPEISENEWVESSYFVEFGQFNEDWQKTLIDLEKDDYEFEDGILRRTEK